MKLNQKYVNHRPEILQYKIGDELKILSTLKTTHKQFMCLNKLIDLYACLLNYKTSIIVNTRRDEFTKSYYRLKHLRAKLQRKKEEISN